MKVALAQINPTIGDFHGNGESILNMAAKAHSRGADLVCFPELCVSGYPPKDLLEREAFIFANEAAVTRIARHLTLPAIVGCVERNRSGRGRPISNAAAVMEGGRVTSVHLKALLPTYDVFDEHRYFEPAGTLTVATVAGKRVGVTICEDAWNDATPLYARDPMGELCAAGCDFLVNLSASPFTIEKRGLRARLFASHARKWGRPVLFVNQVGGQDELIFDGHSLAFDATGALIAEGSEFAEDLVLVDLETLHGDQHAAVSSDDDAALKALVLGTRDYARRTGFSQAVLGLSGGIDSSLVAAIAAQALGPENVLGVSLPSRFSSRESLEDAEALARNLGIQYRVLSIDEVFQSFLHLFAPVFLGRAPDVTEENLQARIRGTTLMALSNKFGMLLLTTGNKSELGVGYCTLYGDMSGGLAVVGDVPKMLVYRLADCVNRERAVIPHRVFTKPPSAELRPNQTDQDTLPPYALLDSLLEAHVEQGKDLAELLAEGFDASVAEDVVRRAYGFEYKRWQMPPGLKITSKAFGGGRRMPIAHAWRGGS